jgi:hypothetical protein
MRHVGKHAGVLMPDVIHHGAVEFFMRAAAFAPLEILHAVRAVGNRLQSGQPLHTRTLQFIDAAPVDVAGRAFHHEKRTSAFQRAIDVVYKGGALCQSG